MYAICGVKGEREMVRSAYIQPASHSGVNKSLVPELFGSFIPIIGDKSFIPKRPPHCSISFY